MFHSLKLVSGRKLLLHFWNEILKMPSLFTKTKKYESDVKQDHIDSDIHAITEKCGMKMKNYVDNNDRMSESKAAAIKLTTSLREQLTRDTTRRRTRRKEQRQGSPQRHLSNADYASSAKMEQSKWLAARNRPVPKRELPPRDRPRREDIVRRLRERADRYADAVMKIREEKLKNVKCDDLVEEVPFILSKEDLKRYDILPNSSDHSNPDSSDHNIIPSLTSNSSISTRTDLDPDKIIDKCLKECVSIFNVPLTTDPIRHIPKNPVVHYNVNPREKDGKVPKNTEMKQIFLKKKKPLNSQSPPSKETESDANETREPLSKKIQKIFEMQEAFVNDCNKIINPSKFEFSNVVQSLNSKRQIGLGAESKTSPQPKKILQDILRARRADAFTENSFMNNFDEELLPAETSKSAGDIIRCDRVGTLNKSVSMKYFKESNSSTSSDISLSKDSSSKGLNSQNDENDSELKKLFTQEQVSVRSSSRESVSILSGNSTRCKLAQNVFSWKNTQKCAKSFKAEDFQLGFEDNTLQRAPVLNLIFSSDNPKGYPEEIKPIKLQKSSTIEVQVPIIESVKPTDDGKKMKKNKCAENVTRLSDIMARKVLSQKRLTPPDGSNTSPMNNKYLLKNDGVELRMRNIPEVSRIKSKRTNYFSISKGLLEDYETSEIIHHTTILNLQYIQSMRELTVQN